MDCTVLIMTWNLVNINCLNCVSHPGVELCLIGYPWPVYPGSTGILPHSLPEWAFRARPGIGGFAFALKLPELLNRNLAAVRAKLGQTSCFPNGPQIWCPKGQ